MQSVWTRTGDYDVQEDEEKKGQWVEIDNEMSLSRFIWKTLRMQTLMQNVPKHIEGQQFLWSFW